VWLPTKRGNHLTKSHIMPAVIIVIFIVLGMTGRTLFTALGANEILEAQIDVALDSIEIIDQARDSMMTDHDTFITRAEEEQLAAATAIAEAEVAVNIQENIAETSFRRAEELATDNPVLEQAIQEMRADAIVVSLRHEEQAAESAAALFEAQQRIRTLTIIIEDERNLSSLEITRLNSVLALAIERGNVLENAIAPSFFPALFKNTKFMAIGAAVGAGLVLVTTR